MASPSLFLSFSVTFVFPPDFFLDEDRDPGLFLLFFFGRVPAPFRLFSFLPLLTCFLAALGAVLLGLFLVFLVRPLEAGFLLGPEAAEAAEVAPPWPSPWGQSGLQDRGLLPSAAFWDTWICGEKSQLYVE